MFSLSYNVTAAYHFMSTKMWRKRAWKTRKPRHHTEGQWCHTTEKSIVAVPKKKQWSLHICRHVQSKASNQVWETHIMPTTDNSIHEVNESTVFSKLDLTNAYHHLELSEESKFITTFSIHVGLRHYKRLLFRVSAAARIFQKATAKLPQDIPGPVNLSDDIIIHGKHKLTMIAVSVCLCGNSSTMEQSWTKKNASFQPTSWHSMAMSLVITPDPAEVQVIVNTEPPWSVLEIQLFLGMAQYVVWFILHYSTIVKPLHRLMMKEAKWSWGEEEQAAFQKLKETLTMPMFLHTSVPRKVLRWLLMPVQYVWQGC